MYIPDLDSEVQKSPVTKTTQASPRRSGKYSQKEQPVPSQQAKRQKVESEGTQKKHKDRAQLEAYLKQLNVPYQVEDHEEVFTVDALMQNVQNMPGLHMKNLFLKDKKKNFYLLSARHNAEVSRTLSVMLHSTRELPKKGLAMTEHALIFTGLVCWFYFPYSIPSSFQHV